MSTRKAAKKTSGKRKAAKRAPNAVNTSVLLARIRRREWVMYGIPIFNVAAVGNVAEMRRVAQAARTHLADVKRSIAKLDAAIRAGSR